MRGLLLDTNVLSELRRPRPQAGVSEFVAAQPGEILFISEVTLAEIRFGIELLSQPERRTNLNLWLDRTLRPLFERRTLPVSEEVLLRWRQMVEVGRKRGHTFAQPDLFIAASAALEELVVVSRDTAEFIAAGVPVLDPWHSRFTDGTGTAHSVSHLARPDLLAELGRLAGSAP